MRVATSFDFEESGEGPAILFVPGSYATTSAWRGIQTALPRTYRCISTSLCGYGRTAETRSAADFGIEHNVAVVRAAARRAGGPVHLVGHSWGGLVALAALLEGGFEALSLTCFEANPWSPLAWAGRQDLIDGMRRMAADFEAAVDRGEADACALVLDYWGQKGSFASMSPKAQDYCRSVAGVNVIDWRGHRACALETADMRRLGVSALFVRGSLANPAMVVITDALAGAAPTARMQAVEGATHFLIGTHPAECAAVLHGHIRSIGTS